jgi:carboxymethylenebutenolidase
MTATSTGTAASTGTATSTGIQQKDLSITGADGRAVRAVLTLPAGATAERPGPAVLIIHEAFGIDEGMRGAARRFAEHGHASLMPDLFDQPGPRVVCMFRVFRSLMAGSGPAFNDLDAARRALADRPEVDGSRIGVAGFCMGGGFAIVLAAQGQERYRASAPFYGRLPKDADALRGACPVVASFGGRDAPFKGAGPKLEAMLARAGVTHDVKTYPDAGHAFATTPKEGFFQNVIGPILPIHAAYHEPSAEDAWRRVVAFFNTHVRDVVS